MWAELTDEAREAHEQYHARITIDYWWARAREYEDAGYDPHHPDSIAARVATLDSI
jgi:hypothetical protein